MAPDSNPPKRFRSTDIAVAAAVSTLFGVYAGYRYAETQLPTVEIYAEGIEKPIGWE